MICGCFQGHSVNVLTIDHVTPLHEACAGDHVACARALIDAGANVSPVLASNAQVRGQRLSEERLGRANEPAPLGSASAVAAEPLNCSSPSTAPRRLLLLVNLHG